MYFYVIYYPKGKYKMKNSDFKPLIDTPFGYTLSLISGKWKMVILYLLHEHEIIRYNELQRKIGSITYKMLSSQLKELEESNLINRKAYPSIPPKVEYSLTKRLKMPKKEHYQHQPLIK